MSLHRKNPKRDGNEPDVIEAYRKIGAVVIPLSIKGKPDLLVGFRGKWFLIEVKMPKKTPNEDQTEFLDLCWDRKLPAYVVHGVTEALSVVGFRE